MDDKVRKIINTNSVDPRQFHYFRKGITWVQRYDNQNTNKLKTSMKMLFWDLMR
jgi:hypothetical protein